jgi:hypothetical protein
VMSVMGSSDALSSSESEKASFKLSNIPTVVGVGFWG